MTAGYLLMTTAARTPLEVVAVDENDGFMRLDLRIPEEDVDRSALAVLFALAVLSFAEAKPIGLSKQDYQEEDQWSVDDLVDHLHFRRGHLVLDTDYVRGRLMKTTIEAASSGDIALSVRNRGAVAKRWVAMLKGKVRHVELVDAEAPRFIRSDGPPVHELEDWASVPLPVARAWAEAEDGVPAEVGEILDREPLLARLRFSRGVLGDVVPTPPQDVPVVVPLTIHLDDDLGNDLVLVVLGADERGLGPTGAAWSSGSEARARQLLRLVDDLTPSHDAREMACDVPFRLLEQSWAVVQQAADRRATRAVLLLQGAVTAKDWASFEHLALLLGIEGPVVAGQPLRVPETLSGVSLWLAWAAPRSW